MKNFPHHTFREYDIRGIAGTEITEELAYRLGLAYATLLPDGETCIQITASHNPGEYNGFKMMQDRDSLHGEAIQRIKSLILSLPAKTKQRGKVNEAHIHAAPSPIIILIRRLKKTCGISAAPL